MEHDNFSNRKLELHNLTKIQNTLKNIRHAKNILLKLLFLIK